MSLRRSIVALTLALSSSFALAAGTLGIHGPERIGVSTNRPFLFLVPATGSGELIYSAQGLPSGLSLNPQTGIIKGSVSAEGEYNVQLTVSDKAGTITKPVTMVVGEKAIALTPIMGWNPWYVYGCNIDDGKIRQAADLLVSSGLAAHGYNYINLDDCWSGTRNADGEMVPNARFPDMKALADYVHAKGLRIGIYTSPGAKTCALYEGTKDHDFERGVSYLEKDVTTYANWGFDFIKYDWCIFPSDPVVKSHYMHKQQELYQRMSDALAKSSRAFVHMICQYGEQAVWEWAASVGGNMWRTNNDLADTWPAVMLNGFQNLSLSPYASPGHWNDLDMLMVGKANWPKHLGQYDIPNDPPRPTQLTQDEQMTHMTLWSLMASPLIFSGDLSQLDPWTTSILTNDEMLAVNQDALAAPVKKVFDGDKIVVTRALANGDLAVAMFNLNPTAQSLVFTDVMIGMTGKTFTTKNVWTGEVTGPVQRVEAQVAPHGTAFYRLHFQ